MLQTFFKTFIILFALSLIVYSLTSIDLLGLLRINLGFLGISIIFSYIWPEIRGIKKGDEVAVVTGNIPRLFGIVGKALTDAKKGNEIRVLLDSGKEIVGIVESYPGIISKAKVRILYEEHEKE